MEKGLVLDNLQVQRSGAVVLTDFSLHLEADQVVVLSGPNGAGKSTLALTLFAHPSCLVTRGDIRLDGKSLLPLKTDERSRLGLFLAHQEPSKIGGVTVAHFLRAVADAQQGTPVNIPDFYRQLRTALAKLGLPEGFSQREVNAQFSGGEKKRTELLALLLIKPRFAVLDEIDSGMDATAKALTKQVIGELRGTGTGFLVISHNPDFAQSLLPNRTVTLLIKRND